MAAISDIVVIGGGVNGASIAFNLAHRGARVTLVEKGALASGPTGRSCGIVRQHYSHEVTARMARRALEIFENFDEIVGGECDFRRTGFMLAVREEQLDGVRANVELQRSVGIDTRMIGIEELRELQPDMETGDLAGAAYEPGSGYADPHATTVSYARRAAELGARLRIQTRVLSILVAGGRVRGVETDRGQIHADVVVLAAGPWSPRLARLTGLELPVTPSRVQVCLFEPTEGVVPRTVFVDSPLGVYTRPETGPLLLVGSIETREGEGDVQDPDDYDESPDLARIEHYTDRVTRRIPAMLDGSYRNGWASLYDVTSDWQPILDQLPVAAGLYCAAGSSGHGFKLAPVVGELVARHILEGARPPELEMFSLGRFEQEALAAGRYPEHKILG